MKEKIKDLIPYTGSYNAANSTKVITSGENFMWHQMAAYQWYHETEEDIKKTIGELQTLLINKQEIKALIFKAIDNFDWSHMYSDDSRPTRVQTERNKEFNEAFALCPKDIQVTAYQYFITQYMKYAPYPFNPISFEAFTKGVNV